MNDVHASLLAVAVLTEHADSSRLYRLDPGRPLKGYLIVAAEGASARIDLFLENARPLCSRSAGEAFYYEGWILTDNRPLSLGAFNTSMAGVGNLGAARPTGEFSLEDAAAIRVTAEPFGGSDFGHTPVLEGQLQWVRGPGQTDHVGETAAEAGPAPAAGEEAPATAAVEPSAELNLPTIGSASLAEMAPVPGLAAIAGLNAMPSAVAGTLPGTFFGSLPAPPPAPWLTPPYMPALEPQEFAGQFPGPGQMGQAGQGQAGLGQVEQGPVRQGPVEQGQYGQGPVNMEELRLEPGTPPHDPGIAPATQSIPLVPRHPMTPRASGQVQVNRPAGSLTVTVRGLPSPPSLGREAGTDRPFNAYRVWLLQQRTGARLSLGHCTRVWGDNYRFESEPNLPLARYDTVLITADDRSSLNAGPTAPQVLAGGYALS